MIKAFLSATLLTAVTTAMGQQSIRINARLTTDADTLFVQNTTEFRRDTIVGSHGQFILDIPANRLCDITIGQQIYGNTAINSVQFKGMPGEEVIVNGQLNDYRLSGSVYYEGLDAMLQAFRPFDVQTQLNISMGSHIYQLTEKDQESAREFFFQNKKDIELRRSQAALAWIKSHADIESSALLIGCFSDVHQCREAYDALSERIRQGRMNDYMRPYIERADKEIARLKVAEHIQPGLEAPLFTLKDLKNKSLPLKSLRGQYVILDFWGSWCFWCLAGVPKMKEYYEKYRGRFEILSIDCNDTPEKWREAVAKNAMPWLHVRNTGTDHIPELYAVSGYPTKIILNPDGTINQVFIGEKEEFYQYLDQLFTTTDK